MSLILCLFFMQPQVSQAFGPLGHEAVAEVAFNHLNEKAKLEVKNLLGKTSMAKASTWPDRIRSNKKYNFATTWHWVTIPTGMRYKDTEKEPNGDVIKAMRDLEGQLKDSRSAVERSEALSFLIHFVADVHQPMHVGRGDDRGGNECKIELEGKKGNLHRLWDSMLFKKLGSNARALAKLVDRASRKEIERLQSTEYADWAHESQEIREEIYPLKRRASEKNPGQCQKIGSTEQVPFPPKISEEYYKKHIETLKRRIMEAGVRLAGVLNRSL